MADPADAPGRHPVPPRLERARRAWAELGTVADLVLERADVWTVALPFRRPVATAVGVHTDRPLVILHLVCRGPDGEIDGWGECAALADTTYDLEDAAGAAHALETSVLPALMAAPGGRALPPPTGLDRRGTGSAPGPLVFAVLEQAVADAHLRAEGRSLVELLGVAGLRVPVGAVVGAEPDPGALVAAVHEFVSAGYARVKVKIAPGRDVDHVAAVRAAFPDLLLQADANGAYRVADGDHLTGLDPLGLACLEQPLGRDDLTGHAELASRLSTPVCLDESLDGPGRVADVLDAGACSVICLKPARLGGVGAALDALVEAAVRGAPTWVGGMFEGGFGRAVLASVAALGPGPGPAYDSGAGASLWPGDLAPPSSYLDDDVAPALDVVPDPTTGHLAVVLPARPPPGLAAPPDPAALERRAVRRATVTP